MIKMLLMASFLFSQTTNSLTHIQDGENAMLAKNWQQASISFQTAANSRRLNDFGKAVCYWNIYVAEANMGEIDNSMIALIGFMLYGTSLDGIHPRLIQVFKKGFRLRFKLDYAYALIQATWAGRNGYSCRTKLFSCHIADKKFIAVFKKEMPFCAKQKIKNVNLNKRNNITKVTAKCSKKSETYYFNIQ